MFLLLAALVFIGGCSKPMSLEISARIGEAITNTYVDLKRGEKHPKLFLKRRFHKER